MARGKRTTEKPDPSTAELEQREYRDEDGNVHHHTHRYMEQHGGLGRGGNGRPEHAEFGAERYSEAGAEPDRREHRRGREETRGRRAAGGWSNGMILLIVVVSVAAIGFGARLAQQTSPKTNRATARFITG